MSSSSNPASFKQRVLRAGGWSIAGYGLSQAIRLGSNLIMTRLLLPEMFGVMAIATIVTVIIWMLSDVGLNQNIVQSKRGDDPLFLDTLWVVQIIRGGIMYLAVLALCFGLYVANAHGLIPENSVYAMPILPAVVAVNSFALIIYSFQSTKIGTAFRKFDQKRLMQINLAGQISGLAVMIVIGLATRSIWALVAGGLVTGVVGTVLSHTWLQGHSNRLRWDKAAFRELIGFGKWILVSSMVYVLAVNGDRILLGAFVNAHELGLYAIAALMIAAIEGALSRLFTTVSMPALSEIVRTDPSRLRSVYYRLRVPCDVLLLFVTGLLFAAGQLVIDLLYDHRYASAGPIMQVLALSLFTVRYGVALEVYVAMGIPRYQAIINMVRCLSLYALVPFLSYSFGMQAAIWGIALHALATVPLIYAFNARLKINDFRRELQVLIALPAGYLFGVAINLLVK
jgi:O-antigen/teichoic acid export membrane protein